MPKITIIKIIHFTIDFLLAGFQKMSVYLTDSTRSSVTANTIIQNQNVNECAIMQS